MRPDRYDLGISPAGEDAPQAELLIATVDNYSSSLGTTLIFDGTNTATAKRYRKIGSGSLLNGSRVLVAKVSGTYLIIGRIY